MGKIKNLLFDLGGVIIGADRDACVSALTRLGMRDAEQMIGLYVQTSAFGSLESGEISAEEFRDEMRCHFDRPVTDAQIDSALDAFISGLPVYRLESLRQLHSHYRLYVLSNTNPILFNGRIAELFKGEGLTINDYFDGITTSYEAGACKPSRKIFDYAVTSMGIDPAETMFFDDGQVNVDAAISFGFNAALVPEGGEFVDVMKQLGL